jgi:hypothetical protein
MCKSRTAAALSALAGAIVGAGITGAVYQLAGSGESDASAQDYCQAVQEQRARYSAEGPSVGAGASQFQRVRDARLVVASPDCFGASEVRRGQSVLDREAELRFRLEQAARLKARERAAELRSAESLAIRRIDFRNFTFEVPNCPGGPVTMRVRDGTWRGQEAALDTLRVRFVDVTDDDAIEALVYLACSPPPEQGGNLVLRNVLVFTMRNGNAVQLGQGLDGYNPRKGGRFLSVDRPAAKPGDPSCCPSQIKRTFYRLQHSLWTKTNSITLPAGE